MQHLPLKKFQSASKCCCRSLVHFCVSAEMQFACDFVCWNISFVLLFLCLRWNCVNIFSKWIPNGNQLKRWLACWWWWCSKQLKEKIFGKKKKILKSKRKRHSFYSINDFGDWNRNRVFYFSLCNFNLNISVFFFLVNCSESDLCQIWNMKSEAFRSQIRFLIANVRNGAIHSE